MRGMKTKPVCILLPPNLAELVVTQLCERLEAYVDRMADEMLDGGQIVVVPAESAHPASNATLTRRQLAAELTRASFPIAEATLKTLASRGGGPPYRKVGSRVVYEWGASLNWAQSKLGPVQRSTSEDDAPKARSPRSTPASTEATA